ncbi:MAG: hypothetical protein LBQ74_03810 [Prevotella sp.]|jgi:hypothetical protein|nr:hypothetical protein [Prevotella sp.]
MSTISFEYAQNLNENEQQYEEITERVGNCIIIFAKNTFLQFTNAQLMFEMYDIHNALRDGQRGGYLFNKALEYCESVEALQKEFESEGMQAKLSDFSSRITERIKKGQK